MDKTREGAYAVLLEVEDKNAYVNISVGKYIKNHEVENPDLLRRLVYGVMEKRIYLDYFLDRLLTKGIAKTDKKTLNILRLGAYQLEFMDSVPDYAAIDSAVELSKKYAKGRDGFVNGVLRNWQRKKSEIKLPNKESNIADYLSIKYSCHGDIVNLFIDELGYERAESVLESQSKEKDLYLRVNTNLLEINDAVSRFKELGIESGRDDLSPRVLNVKGFSGAITDTEMYRDGEISIQSPESCWIADLVEPGPGMRVLDLCGAPGGKTMAMAEAMKNQGEIISCDIHPHRCKLIDEYANRCKIDIVKTICMDGTKANDYVGPAGRDLGSFDRVLIDAPCSGLGVIGRKPDLRFKSPGIDSLVEIQRELLKSGASLLKPGGRMVYSTCTISQRENRGVVEAFLESDMCKDGNYSLIYEKQLYPDLDGHDGFYVAIIDRYEV